MRLQILVLLMAWTLGTCATAQSDSSTSPEQQQVQAVRATLDALFDGMRAGDSTAVRSLFAPQAQIRVVEALEESGRGDVRTADDFAQAVGKARDVVWDERIWDVDIRVDGPMAAAWMPYVFYLDDERSHCGVNSVHLVRRGSEWRIQHITYTRREECDVPQEVQK